MKKALVKILILLALVGPLFLYSNVAQAQSSVDANDYVFLENLPTGQTSFEESDGSISNYFTRIYFFAMTAAVFLAVLMLVIAGVEYTASGVSVSSKESAKKRIRMAIGGLILIFASWLLLRTINPDLVNPSLILPEPGNIPLRGGNDDESANSNGWQTIVKGSILWDLSDSFESKEECEQAGLGGSPCTKNGFTTLDNIIRSRLNREGVGVKSNKCQRINQSGCTTVALLPEVAIKKLILLKEDCDQNMSGCEIFVTGGTEGGHATHGPRKAIVDLRSSSSLNEFLLNKNGTIVKGGWAIEGAPISSNFPEDCTEVRYGGGLYKYEAARSACSPRSTGTHWHVVF